MLLALDVRRGKQQLALPRADRVQQQERPQPRHLVDAREKRLRELRVGVDLLQPLSLVVGGREAPPRQQPLVVAQPPVPLQQAGKSVELQPPPLPLLVGARNAELLRLLPSEAARKDTRLLAPQSLADG